MLLTTFIVLSAHILASTTSAATPGQFELWHTVGSSPVQKLGDLLATDGVELRKSAKADAVFSGFKSSKDLLYKVQVRDGQGNVKWQSSVPTCRLTDKDAVNEYRVHVDTAGNVYHVDMVVQTDKKACNEPLVPPKAYTVKRITMTKAPIPILEVKRAGAGNETPEDEKTFFQKYWLYMLIAGAVLLVR